MIRLSYSALEDLHTCERFFQINRLLAGDAVKETSQHLSFGSAFGAGAQSYLVHQNQELALYEAWLAYWPEEEDDKKSVTSCLTALEKSFIELDSFLMTWEIVELKGQPATELSFRIDIDSAFYFVGYIDAVVRNRFTGQYAVIDFKTTGLSMLDLSPLYCHSGQALGYSIVLDQIVGAELAEYQVLYGVCQLGKQAYDSKFQVLEFDKTLLDRLNWFLTLGLDVKRLHEMSELNVYPKRGGSCVRFMKPCRYFGSCHLHSFDSPKIQEEDTTEYQFVYNLEDVINNHLARLS